MSRTAKQHHFNADNILSRIVPIKQTPTQAQLVILEAQLNYQLRLSLKRKKHLLVHYDAKFLGFEQVFALLHQAGISVSGSPWFSVKSAWYRFVDANVASQANARSKPCCNRVPRT